MDVNRTFAIAKIEYFFQLQFGDIVHSFALVLTFSPPDQDILKFSHHAVYICQQWYRCTYGGGHQNDHCSCILSPQLLGNCGG